jgi:two-component system, sensor histidine kinase PdtaS
VGRAYTGKISQQPIFNFSIRRSSPDGNFHGVVGSSAYVTYFENFYARAGSSADDFAISLVRDDGEILPRYPRLEKEARFAPDSPVLKNIEEGLSYGRSVIDAGPRLYGHRKVGDFPVSVVYELNPTAFAAEWRRAFIGWGITTALVSISLIITLWFALERARAEQAALVNWHEAERTNEEREALFREVAHRVQNNLQLLVSMLSLEQKLARNTDPERLLSSVIERVRTMARLHNALFQRGTSGTVYADQFFEQFAADLRTGVIAAEPIVLSVNVTKGTLRLDQAVTIGLIVNELVTNAVKYAFKGKASGEIRVSFLRDNDQHVLNVVDNGEGFDPAGRQGFGAQLIRILAAQLQGQLQVESECGRGSAFTLVFPVRD